MSTNKSLILDYMEDSQAAGKWKTEQGGEYFAAGVGGAITGRGADLLIIDDPHKEQDIKKDSKSFEKAWNWYTSGPRQRLQPGGKIVVCNDTLVYKRSYWTINQGSGRRMTLTNGKL